VINIHREPLLIDFGLSKPSSREETASDLLDKGNIHWCAPEFLEGSSRKTECTDVYAFGIINAEVTLVEAL
jgi:serine/threonine protein kinase